MSSHCNYYPQCFCPKEAGLYCGIGPLERIRQYQIQTIAEHSLIPSLFPYSGAKVLDAGCRGFEFAKELKPFRCRVWCIDADELEQGDFYDRVALSDFDGVGYLVKSDDKQATRIQRKPTEHEVTCTTLKFLSFQYSVAFWDLIKLDIEGSEYEVIMSMEKPFAKQLSIEFHLHTGIYGQAEMTMMEDKLKALGYEAIKHDYTSQHGAGFNYWDSLWVLK